jgi:hypothetical protein
VLRFGWLAFAVTLVAASAVFAADTMAPSEIQATFFTGQAFTARTPSGTKFKMTFTPHGKVTHEPLASLAPGGNASTGSGTWKLNAKVFARPGVIQSLRVSPLFLVEKINGRCKESQPPSQL